MEKSLLAYLRAKNPDINTTACSSGQNTRPRSTGSKRSPWGSNKTGFQRNPWSLPKEIVKWQDFEYEALQSIYDGKLSQTLGRQFQLQDISVPEMPFCQIHDEDSLETLLIKWTHSIISNALSAAQRFLQVRDTERIYMCRGGQAKWLKEEATIDRHPDWAAVKNSTINKKPRDKARNLLPGDTKLSSKWSSAEINPGEIEDDDRREEWFQPMAQIFTYCVHNRARYGYLITDKELVVVRVSPTSPNVSFDSQSSFDLESIGIARGKANKARAKEAVAEEAYLRAVEEGCMEFRVIPWTNHADDVQRGSKAMTVNLALWWLHMMAADDSTIKEQYPLLKDTKRTSMTDPGSQSSSFARSEHSPKTQPVAERSFTSGLDALGLDSVRAGNKRSRKDDVVDADCILPKSPQKRKQRGRR